MMMNGLMTTQPDERMLNTELGQKRPMRTAALRAKQRVQSWMQNDVTYNK